MLLDVLVAAAVVTGPDVDVKPLAVVVWGAGAATAVAG